MPCKIDPTPSTYPLYPSGALDHIAQRLISTQAVRDSKDRYFMALLVEERFCAMTAPISGSVSST
jgi:hypothetical protein